MTSSSTLDSRDSILGVFDQFREDLDDHNDRRERLIKVRTLELCWNSNRFYLYYFTVQS